MYQMVWVFGKFEACLKASQLALEAFFEVTANVRPSPLFRISQHKNAKSVNDLKKRSLRQLCPQWIWCVKEHGTCIISYYIISSLTRFRLPLPGSGIFLSHWILYRVLGLQRGGKLKKDFLFSKVTFKVGPGLLSAERPFRCPKRYLFDPITRLCQREAKVRFCGFYGKKLFCCRSSASQVCSTPWQARSPSSWGRSSSRPSSPPPSPSPLPPATTLPGWPSSPPLSPYSHQCIIGHPMLECFTGWENKSWSVSMIDWCHSKCWRRHFYMFDSNLTDT